MYGQLTLDQAMLRAITSDAQITQAFPFLKNAYNNEKPTAGCGGCGGATFTNPDVTNQLKLQILALDETKQAQLKSLMQTSQLIINYQEGAAIKRKVI
jgi:hypothetical protein